MVLFVVRSFVKLFKFHNSSNVVCVILGCWTTWTNPSVAMCSTLVKASRDHALFFFFHSLSPSFNWIRFSVCIRKKCLLHDFLSSLIRQPTIFSIPTFILQIDFPPYANIKKSCYQVKIFVIILFILNNILLTIINRYF